MGWVTTSRENNGTKGEPTNGKGMEDVAPIAWGDDSSKPSLHDTRIASDAGD